MNLAGEVILLGQGIDDLLVILLPTTPTVWPFNFWMLASAEAGSARIIMHRFVHLHDAARLREISTSASTIARSVSPAANNFVNLSTLSVGTMLMRTVDFAASSRFAIIEATLVASPSNDLIRKA